MRDRLKSLEMRARALMPSPVRKAYRIGRSLSVKPSLAATLTDDLITGARLFASRYTLIEHLPKNAVIAELGTYKGDFAREILARCAPDALHVIDIDYSLFDDTLSADRRLVRHTGLTHDVIASFPDATFDWIYIDADHAYAGCARDAAAAAPKVKPGGHLVFNDFAHIDPYLGRYGVHQAVVEFAARERWPLTHFAYDPAALYDVALERPLDWQPRALG